MLAIPPDKKAIAVPIERKNERRSLIPNNSIKKMIAIRPDSNKKVIVVISQKQIEGRSPFLHEIRLISRLS